MMNPLYSSWNNALDYSRYPRGNTAPTVLPQMHYRYRGSTVHSVPSPRYYREILLIPTVITVSFSTIYSFLLLTYQNKLVATSFLCNVVVELAHRCSFFVEIDYVGQFVDGFNTLTW